MIRNLMKVLSNLFGNNTKINANTIAVKKADNTADTLDNCVIVDSGSNSNGNWIKWADGTMICYKTVVYNNINCNTVWGSLYESSKLNIGNYAQPFINVPIISLTPNNPFLIEKYGDTSKTSFGSWYMVRPKNGSAGDVASLFCVAVGKWK